MAVKNKPRVKFEDTYNDEDSCGIFCFKPKWLQKYANPKIFLLDFSLIAIIRAAYFTYQISVMSTLEKRYAFPSKVSALILIADNLSGMIVSPIIGYIGTKIHGPRLIGFGMILVSLSCILSGMPYFVYGPGTHLLHQTIATHSMFNKSKIELCDATSEECSKEEKLFEMGAYAFLCIASFINGLGYTAFWTIGIPYIDDNVKKKNSPLYLSTTTVVRMVGVTLGFFLSSICLSFYEDPMLEVNIPRNDPRWVGAWWIGFFLLGIVLLFFTIPMFMFPMSLKKKKFQNTKQMSIQDAMVKLKRIGTNPILVCDTIGGAFRMIGFAGFWITKPKYIESQFRQSAAASNFLTGSTSIIMKAVGVFLGGYLLTKFRPHPKVVVSGILFVELTCSLCLLAGFFTGCTPPIFDIKGPNDKISLIQECNAQCECSQSIFSPVCGPDGKTNYFSPCFAGCKEVYRNESTMAYSDCSCVGQGEIVTSGYCKSECSNLPLYLTVISLGGIISSLSRTASILVALRAIDQEDKAFAMGVIGSFMSIFAYIPYPIIFGYITDAACLIWEETCGTKGNCWLYDLDKFRYYLHGAAIGFSLMGTVFDFGVFINANKLKNLYEDEDETGIQLETQIEEVKQEEMTILDKNQVVD